MQWHLMSATRCMCINRDIKMAVVWPSTAYLKKTTFFFSYRIKAQKQLTSQLFPLPALPTNTTIWDSTKRWEENKLKIRLLLAEHCLFNTETMSDRGVVNVFTNTQATLEQAHDLLNARQIGQQGYVNYVTHYLLQLPSVHTPIRRKQLLTIAPLKVTKRWMSQKQKEQRETLKCLRKQLAWCNQTGNESEEQYSVLPQSLADLDSTPHKGNKTEWTEKLKGRYKGTDSFKARLGT